jgi:hypothetical protein
MLYCIGLKGNPTRGGKPFNFLKINTPVSAAAIWGAVLHEFDNNLVTNDRKYTKPGVDPLKTPIPDEIKGLIAPIYKWFDSWSHGKIIKKPIQFDKHKNDKKLPRSAQAAGTFTPVSNHFGLSLSQLRIIAALGPAKPMNAKACDWLLQQVQSYEGQPAQILTTWNDSYENAINYLSKSQSDSNPANALQDAQVAQAYMEVASETVNIIQLLGQMQTFALMAKESGCGSNVTDLIDQINTDISYVMNTISGIQNGPGFIFLAFGIQLAVENAQGSIITTPPGPSPAIGTKAAQCIEVNAQWYGFNLVLSEECTQSLLKLLQTIGGVAPSGAVLTAFLNEIGNAVSVALSSGSVGSIINFLKAFFTLYDDELQTDIQDIDKGNGITLNFSFLAMGLETLLSGGNIWPALIGEQAVLSTGGGGGFACELYQLMWISAN